MKSNLYLLAFILLTYISACNDPKISYNNEVKPILTTKCLSCHGGVKKNGGISFLSADEAIKTAKSGKQAIIPGNARDSELIKRISHNNQELRMPYQKPPLSAEEIETLKTWINQGADFEDHWAFSPPAENPVLNYHSNPEKFSIDFFIDRKLSQAGLTTSDKASPQTIARRAALDIIGIPAPEYILTKFLKEPTTENYQEYLNKLLELPEYGEKWTSMWLDLARYADTQGYEKDPHRDIWSYRDYVIKSFNDDKPYNQFIIEQLAGDLLSEPTDEALIATAFHRNTMTNTEGGTDDEEFRVVAVIDRVNTTYEAILGITMSCVQCHDHPYDPIIQKNYYQSYALFNTQQDADLDNDFPLFSHYPLNKRDSIRRLVELYSGIKIDEKSSTLNQVVSQALFPLLKPGFARESYGTNLLSNNAAGNFENNAKIDFGNFSFQGQNSVTISYNLDEYVDCTLFIDEQAESSFSLGSNNLKFEKTKTIRLNKPLTGKHHVTLEIHPENSWKWWQKGTINTLLFEPVMHEREYIFELNRELSKVDKVTVPVLKEQTEDIKRVTQIFEKGNWTAKGEAVEPDIPNIFRKNNSITNRLEFAQWVANPNNPLTARVYVNRIWEQIFGQGLTTTLSDFGAMGEKPSHPELLDWLAIQFVSKWNWSTKELIRHIMLSSTYQQSSKVSKEKQAADPSNKWLSRGPRVRLSAEQTHDQLLAVSELLSLKKYGPSVMPAQPDNIWSVVYSGAQWKESEGADRYRRSLYTYWRRTSPYPSMVTFDSPSREYCVSQRVRTNTPLQALVMLNDTLSIEAAQSLAAKTLKKHPDTNIELQITDMYHKAIGNSPNQEIIKVLTELYDISMKEFKNGNSNSQDFIFIGNSNGHDLHFASLSVVANTILNLDAFIMKN